ncbi:MAG TPA: hypothetical protein VIJ69_01250, partial [Actinomycetota bacterium]
MALTQVDLALNEDPSKAVFTFRDGAEPGEVAALIVDLTKLGPAEGGDVVVLERLGSEAASRGRSPARTEDPAAAGVRLRGLSPQARLVVEVAAMMAGPFSVSEVADILGQPAGHFLEVVEEVTRAGILTSDRGRLDIADEEFRRGVYQGLAESLRVGLHGHIGRQLLDRGGSRAVAALHLILG